MEKPVEKHKLLIRQLHRLALTENIVPDNKKWQEFLNRINKTYLDSDQERYLSERSTVIASRELMDLNKKIMDFSRRAGMADVATSILHNVGNILNSTNVSLSLLKEKLHQFPTSKLSQVIELMNNNFSNIGEYLLNDEKGKLIPAYLSEIVKVFNNQVEKFEIELSNLSIQIQHIKEIVTHQQTLSGISGIVECISMSELIDSSLQMTGIELGSDNIIVEKKYDFIPSIKIDRIKMLQLLTNLIQNAKDAFKDSKKNEPKKIIIHAYQKNDSCFAIEISDNGVGIPKALIQKIFSYGFTTKQNGHGFGLHSSALAAKEMGCSLELLSQGDSPNTIFSINIPSQLISQQGIKNE